MQSRLWLSVGLGLALCGCPEDEAAPVVDAVQCSAGFGEAAVSVTYDAAGPEGCHYVITPGPADQVALQTALIEAKPGETLCLAAGTFTVTQELIIDTDNLTLKGAGQDATVLDFSTQVTGANGIHTLSDNVTFEAFKVLDSPGDGIRASAVNNVAFRDVAVIWTKDASDEAGAYGLYPVQSSGVLVEGCTVKGARDAGIYVGQSQHIVVRNNTAFGNVAGIEIENSFDAVVEDNEAFDNTGGILVFNLPGLPQVNGARTVLRNNLIRDNNVENFGLPGTTVGQLPSGAGILIMAADRTEVYGNTITGNNSFGAIVLAYSSLVFGGWNDETFDEYVQDTWFHDNTWDNNGTEPQGITTLIKNDPENNPPLTDIGYGGCLDPDKPAETNCFQEPGATFLQFDLCNGFQEQSEDVTPYECAKEPLPEVTHCAASGCAGEPAAVAVKPINPDVGCAIPYPKLSDYGFFVGPVTDLKPRAGAVWYDVTAKLWSDHSLKQRLIVLPEGQKAKVAADDTVEFPLGTTLVKSFYFPKDASAPEGAREVLETRLLILEEEGWTPHVYLWNDEQTDAQRFVAGLDRDVTYKGADGNDASQRYIVPSTLQCVTCHQKDDTILPLGPIGRQLGQEQVEALGIEGTVAYDHPDPFGDGDLDKRARAYLEANCAHCHNSGGIAGGSGLHLNAEETDPSRLGICRKPAAAGQGAGELSYDIVPGKPEESIMVFRMASEVPGIKMPEVPSLLSDAAGVKLISEWIAAMPEQDCAAE